MIEILKQYLFNLKEDGELDALVPIILTAEDIVPITKPQKGFSQNGVDIHAKRNVEGVEWHYLVTIKRGNIDRTSWHENPQGVRASLEQIIDVYIPNYIKDLSKSKVAIILCCGGDIEQNTLSQWTGFNDKYTSDKIKFDFWNGEILAKKIHSNLLNEDVFPQSVKKDFSKALAYLDDLDYDLRHFRRTLELILEEPDYGKGNKKKKFERVMVTSNLALKIFHGFSSKEGNSFYSYKAAELTLLLCWDKATQVFEDPSKEIFDEYIRIFETYCIIANEYVNKLRPYIYQNNGLLASSRNHITSSMVVLEHLGAVSTIGLMSLLNSIALNNQTLRDNAIEFAKICHELVKNHSVATSPCFDQHSIDIELYLLLSSFTGQTDQAELFIKDISAKMRYAFLVLKRLFPVSTDSLDDILELKRNPDFFEEVSKMSTLLPIIAYFAMLFRDKESYIAIAEIQKDLPHLNFQMWYPSADCDKIFFSGKNVFLEGYTYPSIDLSEEYLKFGQNLAGPIEKANELELAPNMGQVWPGLHLLASRFYRFPIYPHLMLSFKDIDFKSLKEEALAQIQSSASNKNKGKL